MADYVEVYMYDEYYKSRVFVCIYMIWRNIKNIYKYIYKIQVSGILKAGIYINIFVNIYTIFYIIWYRATEYTKLMENFLGKFYLFKENYGT